MSTDELDVDVRTVAVIWSDDAPTVVVTGCSDFEAIGLLRVAVAALARRCPMTVDGDPDEDDDE